MARTLFFIRHKPSGQWYTGKYGYSVAFDTAAVFHQRPNAEKKLRDETKLYNQALDLEAERVPITLATIHDLEVVEFELVQKV